MTQSTGQAEAWRAQVGIHWRWLLAALILGCAAAGWASALVDPDLPMHLKLGEWIVREGRVPFVEPFAWTREGSPFFAYSWLAQVTYYLLLRDTGAWGLHFLQAILSAGAFVSVLYLGHVARWSPWASLLTALLSFAMWTSFIIAVRPQSLLAITIPLSWAAAELIARDRIRAGVILAVVIGALTVNTHLFFVFTSVAGARLLVEPTINVKKVALFTVATVAGWMLTPYLLAMPQIFALNFSGNPLVGNQTSISELEPGFRALTHAEISLQVSAAVLLLLPVLMPSNALRTRERVWYGLLWTAGLVLFALALRGLVLWVLFALPLVARLVAALPVPTVPNIRRLTAVSTLVIPFALMGGHMRAAAQVPSVNATLATRQLAVGPAAVLEPLAQWVACATEGEQDRGSAARTTPRAHTVFNYGSYLAWRLPGVSWSIDSRGIFPDSVARVEAYQLAVDGELHLGAWKHAQLAIVPATHAVNAAMGADSAWHLVRVSIPQDTLQRSANLWVRDDFGGNGSTRITTGIRAAPDTVRPDAKAIPAPQECAR